MNKQGSNFKLERVAMPDQLDIISPGGRIGMIALSTDFNIEQDLRRMLPDEIEVFTNRVMYKNPMTLKNLSAMADDISRAASGILPGLGVDVMIYACTSGTVAIGYEKIAYLIHEQCPDIPVITPVTATIAALEKIGARKISVLTPYIDEINHSLGSSFIQQGFEVINVCGFGTENDIEVTMIPLDDIIKAAREACSPNADALFISCTAFRASKVIKALEQSLKIPVLCSNQVLVWHALQKLAYQKPIKGFGSLLMGGS